MQRARFLRRIALGLSVLLTAGLAAAEDLFIGLEFRGSTLHVDSPHVPPDSMGAVGPDHIVELINGRYSVYTKTDGVRIQTSTLNDFWIDAGVEVRNVAFDPRILYDASVDRWFAVSAHDQRVPEGALFIGVSRSGDPTEGWDAFEVDPDNGQGCWADFPTLGLNADHVVVTVSRIVTRVSDRCGSRLALLVSKEDLIAGGPFIAAPTAPATDGLVLAAPSDHAPAAVRDVAPENLAPWEDQSTRHPTSPKGLTANEVRVARLFGLPRRAVQPIVDLDGGSWPVVFLSDRNTGADTDLFRYETVRPLPQFPEFIQIRQTDTIPVGPYYFLLSGRQPPPKAAVDLFGGEHLGSNVVLRNGVIWAVHTVGSIPTQDAALHWVKIDASNGSLLEQGFLSEPGRDFYYPSIAVNEHDDAVIGFNASSPTEFIGSYAVLGRTREGRTAFGQPQLLQAGQAGYEVIRRSNRNRWGDYSATVVDPTTPEIFWTFQEYVSAEDVWSTRVTQLIVIPERFVGKFKVLSEEVAPLITPGN